MADECDGGGRRQLTTPITSPTELSIKRPGCGEPRRASVTTVRAKDRTPIGSPASSGLLGRMDTQRAHTATVVANRCELSAIPAVTDALRGVHPA